MEKLTASGTVIMPRQSKLYFKKEKLVSSSELPVQYGITNNPVFLL